MIWREILVFCLVVSGLITGGFTISLDIFSSSTIQSLVSFAW